MKIQPQQLNGQFFSTLEICRQFGLNAAEAEKKEKAHAVYLTLPERGEEAELETLLEQFAHLNQDQSPLSAEKISLTGASELWVDEQLQSIGLARLDPQYTEDLIVSQAELPQVLPRQGEIPELLQALQRLLSDIRLLWGERDWLVYWGQGQFRCWLLGLIPWGWSWEHQNWQQGLALPLPLASQPLSVAVLQAAADDWRSYLEPPQNQSSRVQGDWIETLGGQLFLSRERFARLLGYVPGEADKAFPAQALLKALSSKRKAQTTMEKIWDIFRVMPSRLPGYIHQWQEILRWFLPLYWEMEQHITALASALASYGVLGDSLARQSTLGTQLYRELEPLAEQIQLMQRNQNGLAPTTSNLLKYPAFRKSWDRFLGDYGHCGPGSFDLAQWRIRDRPKLLLETLLGSRWQHKSYAPEMELKHQLLSPLSWALKHSLEVREHFLNDVLWALHQMRERLHEKALEAVRSGLLTEAADLWWLFPAELELLEQDVQIPVEQIQQRKERYLNWKEPSETSHTQPAAESTEFTGRGNQMGLARGVLWKPSSPYLPLEDSVENAILVLPHFDSGWIPAAAQAQGVILTQRGRYSRDALLISELGLPLICEAPQLDAWPEGEEVRLDSNRGSVVRL